MSIKTLSPYYVLVPLTNPLSGVVCNSYVANIYIWNGSKVAAPSTPSYTMTKVNASASSGNDSLNISRIVNDFIEFDFEHNYNTQLRDGKNQVWVKIECLYDDFPDVPGLAQVHLATKGYGYFMEGSNPQLPTNKVLLTGDEFKVSRNGLFVLPLLAKEPTVAARVLTITNFEYIAATTYQVEVSANFTYGAYYLFVRAVGDTAWTPVAAFFDYYYDLPEDIASAPFQYRAGAFDTVTSAMVYSATATHTP